MPPKNHMKSKIKAEPIDEYKVITETVKVFNNDEEYFKIKDEKEEEILVQDAFQNQQATFLENLHIKQEKPVDYELEISEKSDDEFEKFFKKTTKDPDILCKSRKNSEKNFPCKTCNENFTSKYALKCHQFIHTSCLKCEKCSKKFKIRKNFDSHKCSFECQICHKVFIRNDNLNQHMTYVHGKWKKTELFTCDSCGKGFKYKKSLVCHMKQHMEVKPFVCEVCDEGFSVKNTYRQHMLTHGGKIPCKLCGKELKPSAIYYHIKQAHETLRNFQCTICDGTFKTKWDLNNHTATHDKKFHCNICDKKFSKKYKLRLHLKIHENPRAFECKFCLKTFSRKDTLDTHSKKCVEIKFIGIKKVAKRKKKRKNRQNKYCSCDFCGENFTSKENLAQHMLGSHNK